MAYLFYTPTAKNLIKKLHPTVKKALREVVEELVTEPLKGKVLREELQGFRSHRYKKYRIIYRYVEPHHRVEIIFAGPRKEVYRQFTEYLKALQS